MKTTKVLSPGDTVTESHAAVLARLGIRPFKVGLKLSTVLENGELIDGSVLEVDEDDIAFDLKMAHLNALSLATNPKIAYYSDLTIPILLRNAISQMMTLSLETGYVTDKTIGILLAKASQQAKILNDKVIQKNSSS